MDTTLLRSGLIVDGLGGRAFRGHVLLRGDRIDAILREEDATPETFVEKLAETAAAVCNRIGGRMLHIQIMTSITKE